MTALLPWVPRINITRIVTATPTISTSPAYTAGDQIGGIMTLTDVIRQDPQMAYGVSELKSVTILDGGKQDSAIDIWFFNVSPTVTSSDNAAFSMSDANQAAQCIGAISIGTTYSDGALNSTSTDGKNLGLPLQIAGSSATPTSIFAIAIARGTPTYTTTTDLQFQFSFYMD
jgi:hypothetical protein